MKCPTDSTVDLVMTERSGIEIDYCPTCRGVWLDRGELDKIIERNLASTTAATTAATTATAAAVAAGATLAPPAPPAPRRRDDGWYEGREWDDDWDDDDHRSADRTASRTDHDDKRVKKKRRSSFLGEIFDF